MGALRAALLEAPQTPMTPTAALAGPEDFAPAPDLDNAQSLLYAAHLASYRLMSNARSAGGS